MINFNTLYHLTIFSPWNSLQLQRRSSSTDDHTMSDSSMISSRAFALYVDELGSFVQQTMSALDETDWDQEMRSMVLDRFHRLKGSSGFFGLENIEDLAADLERRLKSDCFSLAEQRQDIEGQLIVLKLEWERLLDRRKPVDESEADAN